MRRAAGHNRAGHNRRGRKRHGWRFAPDGASLAACTAETAHCGQPPSRMPGASFSTLRRADALTMVRSRRSPLACCDVGIAQRRDRDHLLAGLRGSTRSAAPAWSNDPAIQQVPSPRRVASRMKPSPR